MWRERAVVPVFVAVFLCNMNHAFSFFLFLEARSVHCGIFAVQKIVDNNSSVQHLFSLFPVANLARNNDIVFFKYNL